MVEHFAVNGGARLSGSVDVVGAKNSVLKLMAAALLAEGVIGRAMPQGDILGFAPPFCLTREEADEVVTKTVAAAQKVLG